MITIVIATISTTAFKVLSVVAVVHAVLAVGMLCSSMDSMTFKSIAATLLLEAFFAIGMHARKDLAVRRDGIDVRKHLKVIGVTTGGMRVSKDADAQTIIIHAMRLQPLVREASRIAYASTIFTMMFVAWHVVWIFMVTTARMHVITIIMVMIDSMAVSMNFRLRS